MNNREPKSDSLFWQNQSPPALRHSLWLNELVVFFISAVLVAVVAGSLRLVQDFWLSRNQFAAVEVYEKTTDGGEDYYLLTPVNPDRSIWPAFLSGLSPLALPVAQAAIAEQPLVSGNDESAAIKVSPLIRVGLYKVYSWQIIESSGNYQVLDSKQEVVISSNGQVPLSLWYDRQQSKYYLKHQGVILESEQPFLVRGLDRSILQIKNYYNPPCWNPNLPDNRFRGSLQLVFSPATGNVWMINELPLEDYLKGLAETRANDDLEYLKVMTVVGRSYAYYHMLDNYKHRNEFYNVDAYWDQVYRGYANEERHPQLVQAVEKTYGQVVTYQGQVAVTPYFARSNGRTRNWWEVWYGDPYPWIRSVPVPADKGSSQLGHGVGLSAVGAMRMTSQGSSYQQVIEYFYHNVKVEALY